MILYFLILFLTYSASTIVTKRKRNDSIRKFFLFFGFLIVVLFPGLRNASVGTDTGNYIGHFRTLRYLPDIFAPLSSSHELGYQVLQRIAFLVSENYWSLLTLIAVVCVYFSFKSILILSERINISIFLYITLGSYLFFFNGARQGLAISVFSIAFIHLINRNLIKYIIYVFIASLFHRTALLMLPFYFILQMKFSIKKMVVFSAISVVALSFISTLLSVFFDEAGQSRYSVYAERGATGGFNLMLFFVASSLFFIYVRQFIPKKDHNLYDIYLNAAVFTSIIYLVIVLGGRDVNFLRLTLYFSLGHILIWPLILNRIRFTKNIFFKILFFAVHLLFYFIYLQRMSSLIPYKLNSTLF